jgi:hypothetical protein
MRSPEEQGSSAGDRTLLLAEYSALRTEILKWMEIQSQVITLAIIALGTILTVGLQSQVKNGSLMLTYPPLAMFLSIVWFHTDYRIRQTGMYIKVQIESQVGANNLNWEHYMDSYRHSGKDKLYSLTSKAIFVGTEFLAIIVGVSTTPFKATFLAVLLRESPPSLTSVSNVLLGLAILSLLVTLSLYRPAIQQRPSKRLLLP